MALINSPNQLKYYDGGVGTDGTPIDHLIGGAMGEGSTRFQESAPLLHRNHPVLFYM